MGNEYWRWWIPDSSKRSGKRKSGWSMTAEEAAARGLTERVDGSREVRSDPYGGEPWRYSHTAQNRTYRCINCRDDGFVCAEHTDQPWDEGKGCCGAEGINCPVCNPRSPEDRAPDPRWKLVE
jgi:hypothetical protein